MLDIIYYFIFLIFIIFGKVYNNSFYNEIMIIIIIIIVIYNIIIYLKKPRSDILYSRLSFDCPIKSLCSRLKNGTLSYLNRVMNTIDQKSRILLVNALIF